MAFWHIGVDGGQSVLIAVNKYILHKIFHSEKFYVRGMEDFILEKMIVFTYDVPSANSYSEN